MDTSATAALRLGGPSGEVVTVEDIRYYLSARLLRHLESSGDRTSKDYLLLQHAQDFSSPTGVHAAIDIFKIQIDILQQEFSTPKNTRDRDLIREGLALCLSRIKLETELLPKLQKPTAEQERIPEHGPLGHQTSSEKSNWSKEEIEKVKAAFSVWHQPIDYKITEKEVDILLDASLIIKRMRPTSAGDPVLSDLVLSTISDSVKKARGFKNNNEGRGAVVELVRIQAEAIIDTIKEHKTPDADERISRVRHVVTSVQELMGEFGKGSNRS